MAVLRADVYLQLFFCTLVHLHELLVYQLVSLAEVTRRDHDGVLAILTGLHHVAEVYNRLCAEEALRRLVETLLLHEVRSKLIFLSLELRIDVFHADHVVRADSLHAVPRQNVVDDL